ncbi:MAG: PD40 domain-containing protein [Ignavibacteriae bacterium]|nr:PD40 domain-containing protein [Ignavibacteriota bacterium]
MRSPIIHSVNYFTIIMVVVSILFYNCSKKPTEIDDDDPCIYCPFDFILIDFHPAWSPDGMTIAYVHSDTNKGKTGIYLIESSGANNRLFFASAGAGTPDWSPNGDWLVFENYANIFKIKTNGDSLIQLTSEGSNYFPSWSSDNNWIFYDSNRDSPNGMNFIWKMTIDGTIHTRIVYTPLEGEARQPNNSYSNKILHIRFLIGVESSEIFEMNSDGSNITRLTFNSATDRYPKYSSDGSKIAFSSQSTNNKFQISVMDYDGKNIKQLTTTQGYYCDWSPNSNLIVYTDSRLSNGKLWIMHSDGSNKKQLTF